VGKWVGYWVSSWVDGWMGGWIDGFLICHHAKTDEARGGTQRRETCKFKQNKKIKYYKR